MRAVVAMDSFKGSLSSFRAGCAVKEAILSLDRSAEVTVLPLADGGEGTVDALSFGSGSALTEVTVTGPTGKPVTARYCILPDGITAVMEMAAAAGLTLVPPEDRDPMETTTYGVGEMIRHGIKTGCRRFIMGIGGSATNDGGTGMLSALGYEFLDSRGTPVPLGGKGLEHLHAISADHVLPELRECSFRIACDVTNPLCGENGCSAVYGPQKGAAPHAIEKMDGWLRDYAEIARTVSDRADPNHPGAGAAGGLGFAFLAFTSAVLESGIKIILDEIQLEQHIRSADIIITGEGRLDRQTVMGKAPAGVAALAKAHGKPVVAFAGCITADAPICNSFGIDAFFPIVPGVVTAGEAMDPKTAYINLKNTAAQVFRLINAVRGL